MWRCVHNLVSSLDICPDSLMSWQHIKNIKVATSQRWVGDYIAGTGRWSKPEEVDASLLNLESHGKQLITPTCTYTSVHTKHCLSPSWEPWVYNNHINEWHGDAVKHTLLQAKADQVIWLLSGCGGDVIVIGGRAQGHDPEQTRSRMLLVSGVLSLPLICLLHWEMISLCFFSLSCYFAVCKIISRFPVKTTVQLSWCNLFWRTFLVRHHVGESCWIQHEIWETPVVCSNSSWELC